MDESPGRIILHEAEMILLPGMDSLTVELAGVLRGIYLRTTGKLSIANQSCFLMIID